MKFIKKILDKKVSIEPEHVPQYIYHGTCSEIQIFNALSHAGTLNAAKISWRKSHVRNYNRLIESHNEEHAIHRLKDLYPHDRKTFGTIYKIRPNMTNPFRIIDAKIEHTARDIYKNLMDYNRFSLLNIEFNSMNIEYAIYAMLDHHGYDGIVYKNTSEDRGSDSYISIRKDQFQIAERLDVYTHQSEGNYVISNRLHDNDF